MGYEILSENWENVKSRKNQSLYTRDTTPPEPKFELGAGIEVPLCSNQERSENEHLSNNV